MSAKSNSHSSSLSSHDTPCRRRPRRCRPLIFACNDFSHVPEDNDGADADAGAHVGISVNGKAHGSATEFDGDAADHDVTVDVSANGTANGSATEFDRDAADNGVTEHLTQSSIAGSVDAYAVTNVSDRRRRFFSAIRRKYSSIRSTYQQCFPDKYDGEKVKPLEMQRWRARCRERARRRREFRERRQCCDRRRLSSRILSVPRRRLLQSSLRRFGRISPAFNVMTRSRAMNNRGPRILDPASHSRRLLFVAVRPRQLDAPFGALPRPPPGRGGRESRSDIKIP